MSLVPANSQVRQYIMKPLTGNTSRLSWVLFTLPVLVYVYSVKSFHIRVFKETRAK